MAGPQFARRTSKWKNRRTDILMSGQMQARDGRASLGSAAGAVRNEVRHGRVAEVFCEASQKRWIQN